MTNSFNLEKLKNWKFLGCFLGILGCLQFIILSITAMVFYPGGYSFWDNFISHLGFTRSANNSQLNTISLILFLLTMTLTAVFWIPFWLSIRTVFTKTKNLRYLSWLGTILGLISSPTLILIAFFPGDLMYQAHILATMAFFLLFASAMIIYSIVMLLDKDYENYYGYIGFAMAIMLLLYMSIFLLNAAFQKITVYVLFSWVIIQGIKLWTILE
ncbi:MAG: DUF998 domain-containing protein [Promethearchaeota archaeon]|nr:MAG: DUF998 domain-containing protein [Candidatus Lokiarchaeota archaeon]